MDTIKKEILTHNVWGLTSPKEDLFSGDDLINAYIQGKKEGLEQTKKLVFDHLIKNIEKSGNHVAEVFVFLKENNFTPLSAYLKINSWDDLSIMLIIPEKEFIEDRVLKVYDFLTDFEENVKEELYSLEFNICDTEEDNLNEQHIISDGYFLKYNLK